MKTKHTPGPWHVKGDTVPTAHVVSTDTIVAMCYHAKITGWNNANIPGSHPDGPGQIESKANAKLIAAAPDLLEACQLIQSWLHDDTKFDAGEFIDLADELTQNAIKNAGAE